MEKNFTSLDVAVLRQKLDKTAESSSAHSFDFNIIFLALIMVTLLILSTLLFLLIRKKMQELALVDVFA